MSTPPIMGFPATSQDDYQLNVINILRHAARTFGRQQIVAYSMAGVQRTTYADTYRRVQRLANALKQLGAEPGDRIGVMDWNSLRHFEAYYGVPGIGAVLLLLNIRLAPPDLIYVINHAEAKFILVDETLLPLIAAVAPKLETVKGYVVMTNKPLTNIQTDLAPLYGYEEILAAAEDTYKWDMKRRQGYPVVGLDLKKEIRESYRDIYTEEG